MTTPAMANARRNGFHQWGGAFFLVSSAAWGTISHLLKEPTIAVGVGE